MICYCANVGQYKEDFEAVRQKALKCGASKVRRRRNGGEWTAPATDWAWQAGWLAG